MIDEARIKLIARLYECRDTMKKLYGNEFDQKMIEYKNIIKGVMKKHNTENEIQAILILSKELPESSDNSVFLGNIMAAAVELIEPSK